METYNKIILYVWGAIAVLSVIIITFMGFKQGFDRWAEYYAFTAIALFVLFIRRFMTKKVTKGLNEERNKPKN